MNNSVTFVIAVVFFEGIIVNHSWLIDKGREKK